MKSFTGLKVCLGLSVFTLSGIVSAQDAGALDEIVVTAQKREQTYMEVPISVAVISDEVLDIIQADNFQDLVKVTPSLTISQQGSSGGSGVLIRGIGTTAFHAGVEPTVSTVVDGVALGRTGSFLSDLVDIERVEVLRGPQGTLFGKNASGGVVNVVTKRPSEEFEGLIRFSATDDKQETVKLMVSGSISDSVNGRLTAFWKDFDGYIDNKFNGETLNGDQSQGLRGKLDIKLSDRATLLLIGDYTKQDRNCCVATIRNLANPPNAFSPLLSYDLQELNIGPANNEVLLGSPVSDNSEQSGISAQLTVDFDNFTFTSITAHGTWGVELQQDVDSLPFTQPTYARFLTTSNGGSTDQEQFSQEFRVSSSARENVELTAGLFFWSQSLEKYFQREQAACFYPEYDPALPPSTACLYPMTYFGYADMKVDTKNAAAFGQVDWRFADDWQLSFGLRYTYDDLEFDFDRPTPPLLFPASPPAAITGDDDNTNLSGKFGLQWDLSDSVMTYATYSRGYKSQGFDVIFGMTPERAAVVPPESSDAFEVGLKAELFERRMRLGVSAFQTKYYNFQGQAYDLEAYSFRLTSAGNVTTKGIEVDIMAKPMTNLLLNGAIAYTDAYYTDYKGAGCWIGQTAAQGCVGGSQDVTGGEVPNSPDLKITLQGRYDVNLNDAFDLYISGAFRWQDDTNSSSTQYSLLDIDSYGVFDLTLGLAPTDGQWDVSLFAKNLFDDHYSNIRYQTGDGDNGVSQYLTRDFRRYIGASFNYRFGG